ncbi:MAG: CapA family protein [Ruminococcus sp.]|nr:CapA family protein [Ruminococcus sp.]
MLKSRIFAAGLSLLLVCAATGCRSIDNESAVPAVAEQQSDAVSSADNAGMNGGVAREEATIANVEQAGGEFRVIAVGDNLVQTSVYNSAKANATGDEMYNFDYCYEGVKDIIEQGDISIIDQETLICDNPDIEITGSNFNFNSPAEVGPAVMRAGFNVVSMSNNHLLDKGIDGLISCMDYWDRMQEDFSELTVYGVYRDEADMSNIRVREVNGLTVAFLAYTENTNGYSVPEDSDVQIIYTSEEDIIKAQIEEANAIADVVVVSAHWGVEDTFEVTDGVKAQAKNMVNWGADVIIGCHTHTPQTMEYLTRDDGTQGFVFYSLGNFISAQTYNINLIGEIADFKMVVDSAGGVTVEDVMVHPVITQYDDGMLSNLRLIAYRDYTEELCAQHGLPYAMYDQYYAEWNMERIKEIIDTAIPAEYQKLD